MTIQAGDKMPEGSFGIMTEEGPGALSTDELFSGKKVVLVSVPGAFTPTCSMKHLPGFVEQAEALKASAGSTDFTGLFLGLAFVLVGAAAALIALLFRLHRNVIQQQPLR